MPEINGIEFIKKVKKDYTSKVLVISMFKPIHNENNFYDGYLLKDTDINIVIKAIKSIVYETTPFLRWVFFFRRINFF